MGGPDTAAIDVVTDAIRSEARRWDQVSTDMSAVVTTVNDLYLNETAFWVGSVVPGRLHEAYRRLHLAMWTAVNGAVHEAIQLSDALDRIAQWYDDTDSTAGLDIEAAFTAPPQPGTAGPRAF